MTALTGIIHDLPEAEYHAHTALSSTGARRILDSPARFRYMADHPQPFKKEFDIGSAAHGKVLGVGEPVVLIDEGLLASNGAASTAAAKQFIADARANGEIPLKRAEFDTVNAMAEAVLAHPEARALLEQPGAAEVSLFADDPETGVAMRCRFDYLPDFTAPNPVCVDLKTTAKNASPEGFARTTADHRYDIQQEFYLPIYMHVTGDFTARMKFIVVEKEPPHLVGVYELAPEFAEMGRKKVRDALDTYARCVETGVWPGYDTNPYPLQPPTWLMFQEGAIS